MPSDLVLGEPRFQLQGAQDLDRLAAQRARPRFQQPRGLHGQGRAAGDHAPGPRPLHRGARQRERVDAGMPAEAAVLGGDQHVEQVRRHVGRGGRQPPDAARGGQDGERAALAVQHLGAGGVQAREVGRQARSRAARPSAPRPAAITPSRGSVEPGGAHLNPPAARRPARCSAGRRRRPVHVLDLRPRQLEPPRRHRAQPHREAEVGRLRRQLQRRGEAVVERRRRHGLAQRAEPGQPGHLAGRQPADDLPARRQPLLDDGALRLAALGPAFQQQHEDLVLPQRVEVQRLPAEVEEFAG